MSSNIGISDSEKGKSGSTTNLPPLKKTSKPIEKANPPPSFNPKEDIIITRKSKKKKKKTEEQLERDVFVEDLLQKHSVVMHVDTEEYMKKKFNNYRLPTLSTDPKYKSKQKKEKEKEKEKEKKEKEGEDESKDQSTQNKSKSQPQSKQS